MTPATVSSLLFISPYKILKSSSSFIDYPGLDLVLLLSRHPTLMKLEQQNQNRIANLCIMIQINYNLTFNLSAAYASVHPCTTACVCVCMCVDMSYLCCGDICLHSHIAGTNLPFWALQIIYIVNISFLGGRLALR